MNYQIRKADKKDAKMLTNLRIEVLRSANNLSSTQPLLQLEQYCRQYFDRMLDSDSMSTYLAYEKQNLVGCASVCYYECMPTYDHPCGKYAYLMNLYVRKQYRQKGIATALLQQLLSESCKRASKITLETTEMGRHLYEKMGFVSMEQEMIYLGNSDNNE